MSAHDKEYIFNIGWNRTGTRTLNDCLKALGIKGSHWNPTKHLCAEWAWKNWNEFEEFVITHNYESYADAPWCFPELYKHLDKFFPNAKFILTIREEDKWINSYKNLYENHHKGHEKLKEIPMIANKEEYGWVHPLIFGGKKIITGNEEVYRKIYSTHNNQVKNFLKEEKVSCSL